MDTSSVGSAGDYVVAPPPLPSVPREPEEQAPETAQAPEPAEDAGKSVDLFA